MGLDETILSQRKPAIPPPPAAHGNYVPPPEQPLRPIGTIVAAASSGPLNFRGIHVFGMMLIVFTMVAGLIVAIAIGVKKGVPLQTSIVAMVLMGSSVFFFTFTIRRRADRRARAFVANLPAGFDAADLAEIFQSIRGFGARSALQTLLRGLVGRGIVDRALLSYSTKKQAAPPQYSPLDFPFEPQPLDETQSALIRENASGDPRRRASNAIQRNVLLKGGWAIIAVFGFNLVIAIVDSISKRRTQPGVYSWGIGILLMIFLPVGMRFWDTRQWLLVPGGVLLRRARRGASTWDLTLFDRQSALLAVAASRKRNYVAVVANATQSEVTLITPTEAEFLLRAWISPLPPPPLEMLRELG